MKIAFIFSIFNLIFLAGCSSSEKTSPIVREAVVQSTPAKDDISKETTSSQVTEPVTPAQPTKPQKLSALAEAIRSQSDEKVYEVSTEILAENPSDVKALNALAMYHYKKGRFDLSESLLKRALALSKNSVELHNNLGVVLLATQQQREAILTFRKALELDPNDTVASANLGAIYVREKDYGKAVIVLETAVKKGMKEPRILNNYAIALAGTGSFSKSRDLYQQILKDQQNNREVLYNYAILLIENLQDYKTGLEVINRLKFVGGPAETRQRIIALENKAKAGLK